MHLDEKQKIRNFKVGDVLFAENFAGERLLGLILSQDVTLENKVFWFKTQLSSNVSDEFLNQYFKLVQNHVFLKTPKAKSLG